MTETCLVCGGRGWHTAGGNDPMACGRCQAGEMWADAAWDADLGDSEVDAWWTEDEELTTMPEQTAAHPIYATNDPAVIAEYERVMADRDRYVSLHAHADSEAERYQQALEDVITTAESVLVARGG